jgi:hypothetical protein
MKKEIGLIQNAAPAQVGTTTKNKKPVFHENRLWF